MAHLSRKRKVMPADHGGTISESDFEHYFPRESNLLHENGSFSGINVQGNSLGGFINQISQSAEPMTFRHQSEKVNENRDFFKIGVDRISSCSSSVLPQYFHYRGPISSEETMTASNWQPKANTFSQTETGKTFPVLNSEKVAICPGLENLLNPGHENFFLAANQPLEVCNLASKSSRPLELLQQISVNPDRIAINLDGKSCTWEASNYGSSCNLKRRCHSPKSRGIIGRSSFEVSARVEQNEIDRSLQNVQFGDHPSIICLGDNFKENDQGNRDGSIQGMERTEVLETKILKHSLTDATSSNNGDSPANVDTVPGQRIDQSDGSLRSDEKNKPPAEKVAPKVAEELWDGFLQLNSSVTVSAVAFFKSGEKMPDVKWSESVEVKGKVRLEAFEKYIQDLPRSRNRGLMVISLCWKEGSSKTGLMGMKKVAKGYKEGEKVGFAQLSQGIDLYICPRSDAIITILAKYGFFKGMAAVDDNPNSLIGCVVWRRNQPSSNLVVKKSERKNRSLSEQPPNSPSDPSTQKDGGKKCSPIRLSKSSIPVASTTDCTTLECEVNNYSESKNLTCRKVQPEVCNSSTSANSLVTPSVPSNTSSIAVGLKASLCSDHPSLQGPRGWSLEAEAPLTYSSGLEKPKPSLELQRSVSYLSSKAIKEFAPTPDDDDLPEYDFATACGNTWTALSKPLETAIVDKKLPAEGCGKLDGSLPPIMPTVQSLSASNQRSKHPNIQLPLDVIHKMSLLKKVCGSDQIRVFPILEEKHTAQSTATLSSVSVSAVRPRKNLFAEDDDDMPEWCPPNVELHKQSVPKMNRPSSTYIPSKAPNTSFESFCPGHPHPLLPPLLVATHPSFSTQAFPRAYHCPTTIIAKPAQPRPANGYVQRGPSSSMGFNSNQTLRPFPNPFDINLPSHPPVWRGWRP